MIIPAIGFCLGIVLALYMPAIDYSYSKYLAIAILACLDSVFGGIAALMENRFDIRIFTSGFAGNALLAVGLTYLGEKLGLDLYLAAVFVFVLIWMKFFYQDGGVNLRKYGKMELIG